MILHFEGLKAIWFYVLLNIEAVRSILQLSLDVCSIED